LGGNPLCKRGFQYFQGKNWKRWSNNMEAKCERSKWKYGFFTGGW
jgi:hypothetical protein